MKRLQVILAATALALAACGGGGNGNTSSSSSSSSGPGKVSSVASEIPSSISSQAPFQIAVDATYAPNEYVDPSTGDIKGWDIDLGNALCRVMGVACTWNNVTFDDIIAQLKASTPSEVAGGDKPRYQFSISSWSPTASREASGIDFITYYKAGESWVVKSSGGPTVNSMADLCGHSVAVEAGTTEETFAWAYMGQNVGGGALQGGSDHCNGKKITVESFQTQTDANSALLSGRADIGFLDSPVAAYQAKVTGGKLKSVGTPCSVAPYGIAIVKGSGLEQALTDAVKYLIDNGYYKTILQNWNVTDGAIGSSDVTLNNNNSIGPSCVPGM
jgi:polar amino acid transport system substrate-binding protein